jgi:FkbM family methyltransferase
LQIALTDKTGIDLFNYHNLVQGGALHTLGAAIDYKGDSFEPAAKQHVLAFRIDDLIKNFKLPIPNHIKLDVDGIELAVLLGAEKTLENINTKNLIMELEEGSKDANLIIDYLAGKGMKFHAKYKGGSLPDAKVYNYIFKK